MARFNLGLNPVRIVFVAAELLKEGLARHFPTPHTEGHDQALLPAHSCMRLSRKLYGGTKMFRHQFEELESFAQQIQFFDS